MAAFNLASSILPGYQSHTKLMRVSRVIDNDQYRIIYAL